MPNTSLRPRTRTLGPGEIQLFISVFLYSMSTFALSPLLPAIAADFRLPFHLQALPFSAKFAGAMVASFVAGYMSEYIGKSRVLRTAFIGLAASGLALLVAPAFALVLLGAFGAGAFGASLQLMAVSLMSDLHPDARGYYVNLVQSFFGLGAVTGSFLAGAVLSGIGSWRAFFLLVAATPPVVVMAFRKTGYAETRSHAPSARSLLGMIGQSSFHVPVISLMLYIGSEVGLVSWMCIYLANRFSLDPLYTGAVASAFWLGIALGRIATAYLSRHLPLHSLVVANLLLGSVCVTTGVASGHHFIASILLACTGLFYGGILPTNLAIIGTHYPQVAATALGFSLTVANTGGIVLPWLLGTLAESLGVATALFTTALINLGNAALVGAKFFRGSRRRRTPA